MTLTIPPGGSVVLCAAVGTRLCVIEWQEDVT